MAFKLPYKDAIPGLRPNSGWLGSYTYDAEMALRPKAVTKDRRPRLAGEDLKCCMSFSVNMNRRGGLQGGGDDGADFWFDSSLVDMVGRGDSELVNFQSDF